jgi:hypothetical protein
MKYLEWDRQENASVQGRQLIGPPFRRATVEDVFALSGLIEIAREGLAMHLWSKLAGPMGDPWAIGRDRVRTGAVGLSSNQAVGGVAGLDDAAGGSERGQSLIERGGTDTAMAARRRGAGKRRRRAPP